MGFKGSYKDVLQILEYKNVIFIKILQILAELEVFFIIKLKCTFLL